MLQNLLWNRSQKTEADIADLSGRGPEDICLADFIEWLETKDPDETYKYADLGACVVVQYAATRGIKPMTGRYSEVCHKLMGNSGNIQIKILYDHDCTFGSVLKRAKQLQGERK